MSGFFSMAIPPNRGYLGTKEHVTCGMRSGVDRPCCREGDPRVDRKDNAGYELWIQGVDVEGRIQPGQPSCLHCSMMSWIFCSAPSSGNWQVPAPRCPPPLWRDMSWPTSVLDVRLKMLWPSAATTNSPFLPSKTRT